MSSLRSRGWEMFKRAAPDVRPVNYMIAALEFHRVHGRTPVDAGDPRFSINDFIFDRMIRQPWPDSLSRFVDKVTAKEEAAKLCPGIMVAPTRAVLDATAIAGVEHLKQELSVFKGRDLIAKPAHASGAVLRMSAGGSEDDLRRLLKVCRRDYFSRMREPQYRGLAKRIIVEDVIRGDNGGLPDDYKFLCVGGRPILYEINHGRLSGAKHSRLFKSPGSRPFDEQDGMAFPAGWRMADADRLGRMHEAAAALARPFDYVRIDLYNVPHGIYFGEFTFTPGGSLGLAPSRTCRTHDRYSRHALQALASAAIIGQAGAAGQDRRPKPAADLAPTRSRG